jgi:hypothetical protein
LQYEKNPEEAGGGMHPAGVLRYGSGVPMLPNRIESQVRAELSQPGAALYPPQYSVGEGVTIVSCDQEDPIDQIRTSLITSDRGEEFDPENGAKAMIEKVIPVQASEDWSTGKRVRANKLARKLGLGQDYGRTSAKFTVYYQYKVKFLNTGKTTVTSADYNEVHKTRFLPDSWSTNELLCVKGSREMLKYNSPPMILDIAKVKEMVRDTKFLGSHLSEERKTRVEKKLDNLQKEHGKISIECDDVKGMSPESPSTKDSIERWKNVVGKAKYPAAFPKSFY